jgi:hypothetical protein
MTIVKYKVYDNEKQRYTDPDKWPQFFIAQDGKLWWYGDYDDFSEVPEGRFRVDYEITKLEETVTCNFTTHAHGGGCDVFGPETLSQEGVQEFFDSSMKLHPNDQYYTTSDEVEK